MPGCKSIPDAYYQAARIDGASRWAVFRTIQLPKMRRVLLIAVLLRFMDSFMIYTEPFVLTGGGPGNATTFLSIDLVKLALGQFDLGKAAAMSLVYNLIILAVCWVFYTVMTNVDAERGGRRDERRRRRRAAARRRRRREPARLGRRARERPRRRDRPLSPVPDAADLLARQHEPQDQHRDHHRPDALAARDHLRELHQRSSPIRAGTAATSTR